MAFPNSAVIRRSATACGRPSATCVIAMIEVERPRLEIAQQMHAIEKDMDKAKSALIEDYLDHFLDAGVGSVDAGQRREIADFTAIARYL